jgi:hypothetical protein
MKLPVIPVVVVAVFVLGFVAGRWSAPAPSPASPPTVAAPAATPAVADPVAGQLVGVIAELQQVPNYTYLRLSTSDGDVWAAVPTNTSVAVGQQVSIAESTRMTDFTSKALGRTFASVVFGEVMQGGAMAPAQPGALPPGHPSIDTNQPAVAKVLDSALQNEAPLTLQVVDVHAERKALAGHLVTVRATVKRVTEVQGSHYGHLSDGTGSAANKNDDLVVISKTPLVVGQEVTVQGRVVLNKDVGAGTWPVALENASATP